MNDTYGLPLIGIMALTLVLAAWLWKNHVNQCRLEKRLADLRHQDQRLSRMVASLPEPTFAIDNQSRIILWNTAMERLTGVPATAVLGKGDYEYAVPFHGERRPIMIDLVNHWDDAIAGRYSNLLRQDDLLVAETITHTPHLDERYLRIVAGPLRDESGRIIGAIESLQDITYRRISLKVLEGREELLRILVAHMPLAVAMCDRQMKYLYYNQRWISDLGLPDTDHIGRSHYDAMGSTLPDHWKTQHARCLNGEAIESQAEPFTRADGRVEWLKRIMHPWRTSDGEVGGIIFLKEVITTLKKAETDLRLMEHVLQNSPVVLFRWLPAENWPMDYVSENVNQFGYSAEALISGEIAYATLVHPDDRSRVAREVRQYATGGTHHFQQEYRILTQSGETRWVDDRTMIERDQEGRITHFIGVVIDITERKQAQQEIARRQMFLESVLHHAPDAIITLDDRNRVVDWNPGAQTLFGYTPAEAIGQSLAKLVTHGDDELQSVITQNFQMAISGTRVEPIETVRYHKNGRTVDVIAAGSPIIVDDALTGVVAMYTDITALKKAENELRRNERMLRLVLDTIPVRVFWKDRECRYLGCNRPFAEDAGFSDPSELIGRDDDAMAWTAQAAAYRSDDQAVMAAGVARLDYEEPQTTPEGNTIWLQTSKVPMRDRHGNVIGLLGTYQDISDRKIAVEELQRLRNYLSNIINSMPSVLVGVDREGRVTQWNAQAERVTGLSFEAARTQPLESAFPQLADELERIRRAIRDRQILRDPKIPRKQNGEIRYEDVTIFPLVANGVEGAVIRVDDVTERVRMEEMMIQSEKMLSVGGLAAGMAHEINNPLAGILQNSAVLENRLLGDLPANLKAAQTAGVTMAAIQTYLELRGLPDMLANIRDSGNRAAEIVKNMLSFARKTEHVISSHDLGDLLDQTLDLARTDYDMKRDYDFKQIRIQREYDPAAGPVPCEASKLQQVFLNILKNGAEAMAEVTDEEHPPSFTLRVIDDGPWVRVEIQNSGPGMDETIRRRIFEPFFTTKPVGEGTGLGLSVSYFIITENHGGTMDVRTSPNKGSCFIIRLPKAGKPS